MKKKTFICWGARNRGWILETDHKDTLSNNLFYATWFDEIKWVKVKKMRNDKIDESAGYGENFGQKNRCERGMRERLCGFVF